MGQEDSLEDMVNHSSIPAWKTHGQRSLAGSIGSQRETTDWLLFFHITLLILGFIRFYCNYEKKKTCIILFEDHFCLNYYLKIDIYC